MRVIRFVSICALACLAAFLTALSSVTAADSTGMFHKITLTSSGGFSGRGDGTAMSVDANGKFAVNTPVESKEGSLTRAELTQLRKLLSAVDWKQVQKSYPGDGADRFQDDLAVTIGSKTLETHVSENADSKQVPSAVRDLLSYVKRLHRRYTPSASGPGSQRKPR